jgi:hypothetical protein
VQPATVALSSANGAELMSNGENRRRIDHDPFTREQQS